MVGFERRRYSRCVRRIGVARPPVRLLGGAGASRPAVPLHRRTRRSRSASGSGDQALADVGRSRLRRALSPVERRQRGPRGVARRSDRGMAPGVRFAGAGDLRCRVGIGDRSDRDRPWLRAGRRHRCPHRVDRGCAGACRARRIACTCGACRTCRKRWRCRSIPPGYADRIVAATGSTSIRCSPRRVGSDVLSAHESRHPRRVRTATAAARLPVRRRASRRDRRGSRLRLLRRHRHDHGRSGDPARSQGAHAPVPLQAGRFPRRREAGHACPRTALRKPCRA